MNDNPGAKTRFKYNKLILLGIGLLLAVGLFMFNLINPTTVPTPVLAQEPTSDSDNCIACHTDLEKVQSLAQEEEEASELTSGEG